MVGYGVITNGRITMGKISTRELRMKVMDWIDKLELTDLDNIEIEISQGVNEIAPKDGFRRYEPDPTRKTLVVYINGGSGESSLDHQLLPQPQAFRPIRDDWPEG